MLTRPVSANSVVLVTLCGMEVEDKDEVTLLKDNQLVFFVSQSHELVRTREPVKLLFKFIHSFIKVS